MDFLAKRQLFRLRNIVLRRHTVYKKSCIIVSVYAIRGIDTPYVFTITTCFGLLWPSSGTSVSQSPISVFTTPPNTGQCLHMGSAIYVWF
jgi:hypothetical protein